jgi:glycosyltransferase involved in cell wall biosynthesis
MGRHNYILMVKDTVNAIRKHNITIIQTHGFKPSFLGLCAKLLTGIRWVCFMHGTTAENKKVNLYNTLDNFMQRFADRTVLVTNNQRPKVIDGHNSSRVAVLYNAIDSSHPVKLSGEKGIRKALGVATASKIITVVGRLSPEKGVDVFLNALKIVLNKKIDIHAIIVGDGQEKNALQKLTEDLGISKNVTFTGFSNTPGDYMLESDIIVLPSRSEGIPNVALEAMALGKPLIATAVGGTPEVVEHEKNGLLVPSEQPQTMADAIVRIVTDSALAEILAVNAKIRVKEHFSIESRCKKLAGIYKSFK